MYPGMFEGTNNVEAMVKSGTRALGKANIIDLGKSDERIALLVTHNILNKINDYFRRQKASGIGIMFVFPRAGVLLEDGQKPIQRDIVGALKEAPSLNTGFILSEEREIDTQKDLVPIIESRINIVQGNDVGVQLKGSKSYRVLIRPTLSKE